MVTALILVCSLSSTPDLADCNRSTALHVLRLPAEFASPVACLMHGQAYLAQTAIGESLAKTERVKVLCAPRQATDGPRRATAVR
jgi:hypothetical protein